MVQTIIIAAACVRGRRNVVGLTSIVDRVQFSGVILLNGEHRSYLSLFWFENGQHIVKTITYYYSLTASPCNSEAYSEWMFSYNILVSYEVFIVVISVYCINWALYKFMPATGHVGYLLVWV